jgi:hypothetical protein
MLLQCRPLSAHLRLLELEPMLRQPMLRQPTLRLVFGLLPAAPRSPRRRSSEQ